MWRKNKMEIVRKVQVHSPDAKWLLEKKLSNGKPWINITMLKISKLYNLAGQKQCLYAYITLSNFLGELHKIKRRLEKLSNQFEERIKEAKLDLSNIEVPIKGVYELRIGTAPGAELIAVIEAYDHLHCLISIIDKFNLFKEHYKFFKSLHRNRSPIIDLIARLLKVDQKRIAEISITDFLNKTESYLNAAKVLGEVQPAVLFAALNLELLPKLPPSKRNLITYKLKHME